MPKQFDYVIIGGGLAGLQLALRFADDRFFDQRNIAIIEPSSKTTNDKTWCFWEKGKGQWDKLLTKSWDKGIFVTAKKKIDLELSPYSYKMLRSLDFYEHVRSLLENSPYIKFFRDEIIEVDKASTTAIGKIDSYSGLHIFDSRLTTHVSQEASYTMLLQHFKGWIIETMEPHFDPSLFTMMDYRLKYKNSTSFTYVLPISPTKALIEFTLFTAAVIEDEIYDEYLQKYIKDYLGIQEYKVSETEKGVIPMTDYPFHNENSEKITKIGTGGSWVKGSTGYSFKHTEKKVEKILANIKEGKNPAEGLINERAKFYDAIFLDVLYRNNEMGEKIFTKFYSKNSPDKILKYLDEETGPKEEVSILFSLFHPQFIFSFFRKFFKK